MIRVYRVTWPNFEGIDKKKCFWSRINSIWLSLDVGVRKREEYTITHRLVFVGWVAGEYDKKNELKLDWGEIIRIVSLVLYMLS